MSEEKISKSAFMKVLALAEMRLAVLEHCQRWDTLDPDRGHDYATFMRDTGEMLQRLYPVANGHNSTEIIAVLPETIRDTIDTLFGLDENLGDVWCRPIFDSTIADFRETASEIRRRHFRNHDANAILFGHTLHTTLEQNAEASRRQGYILAGLAYCAVANIFAPPLLISLGAAAAAYSLRMGACFHTTIKEEKVLPNKVWDTVKNLPKPMALQRQLDAASQWPFGRIEQEFSVAPLTESIMPYIKHLEGYNPQNPCRSVFGAAPTSG